MATKIEWTDMVWNVVRGCTPVSEGCRNCYAARMAHRFSGPGKTYEGLTVVGKNGPRWNGKVRLVPELLDAPLHWRKPRRVFVCSMGDLFHKDVPDAFIDRVSAVMALAGYTRARRNDARQGRLHTFQILTKRPRRMREYLTDAAMPNRVWLAARKLDPHGDGLTVYQRHLRPPGEWGPLQELRPPEWPLPWVQVGVSCENQQTLDERVPELLQTPAAVRFVSLEPILGPIDLGRFFHDRRREGFSGTGCARVVQGELRRDDLAADGVRGRRYACDEMDQPETCGAEHISDERLSPRHVPRPRSPEKRRGAPDWREIRLDPERGVSNRVSEELGTSRLDWIIVGGESGPGARPMEQDWVRNIRDECTAVGVPFFYKQKIENGKKVSRPILDGRRWEEFPRC